MSRKTTKKLKDAAQFFNQIYSSIQPLIDKCNYGTVMIPKDVEKIVEDINLIWNNYARKNGLEYNQIRGQFAQDVNDHLINLYYDKVIMLCFDNYGILQHEAHEHKEKITGCYQDNIKPEVCAEQIHKSNGISRKVLFMST